MKLLGTAEAEAEAHLESVLTEDGLTEDILTEEGQRSGDWFPVWNYPERHQVALAAEAEGKKKKKRKVSAMSTSGGTPPVFSIRKGVRCDPDNACRRQKCPSYSRQAILDWVKSAEWALAGNGDDTEWAETASFWQRGVLMGYQRYYGRNKYMGTCESVVTMRQTAKERMRKPNDTELDQRMRTKLRLLVITTAKPRAVMGQQKWEELDQVREQLLGEHH